MPRDLVLINSTHYSGGNSYVYRFPKNVKFEKAKVSLYSFSMYNSTCNISNALNNNTFSIRWLNTNYNFIIPDGYYSYSQLSDFIAYCMLSNGLYFKTSSTPVYPISITENSVRYAAQINILFIPTAANATTLGYSIPSNATWTYPSQNTTPQLILCSGLQSILGFATQNTFPLTQQSTNQSFISTSLPIVSPVYCYLISCNLIESQFNNVPTILSQIPISVSFGSLINFFSPQLSQINIRDGYYNEIKIQLFDQNYNNLAFVDTELTLTLAIDTE